MPVLMSVTTNVKTEYWFHVSDQQDIPVFGPQNCDKKNGRRNLFLQPPHLN